MILSYSDFGQIQVNHETYRHDVILNNGEVEARQKKKSKPLRARFGHTPLGPEENIPWDCKELVIGTGYYGRLPVTKEVVQEAEEKGVDLRIMKTAEACEYLSGGMKGTNAVLHVTC